MNLPILSISYNRNNVFVLCYFSVLEYIGIRYSMMGDSPDVRWIHLNAKPILNHLKNSELLVEFVQIKVLSEEAIAVCLAENTG